MHHRLIGRGHGVRHHRDIGKLHTGRSEAPLVHRAEPAGRRLDVGAEAALDVVAGHLLPAADGAPAAPAQVALAAGDDGGDDHRPALPFARALAGGDNAPADLVAEGQRQGMVRADTVIKVTEVRVADTAAGDLDHHLAGVRGERIEVRLRHRLSGGAHQPTVRGSRHSLLSFSKARRSGNGKGIGRLHFLTRRIRPRGLANPNLLHGPPAPPNVHFLAGDGLI